MYLEHQKSLNEEDFMARIMEFENKKREKIMRKQDEDKDKDLEGCTFHPQLMTAQPPEKRNLDQFLND